MTVKDLQQDPLFQKIAVQQVGKSRYTALTDSEKLIARFHKNPKIVDFELVKLKDKLPGFWRIMYASKFNEHSEGFYNWVESDGKIKKKYMYVKKVNATTADNVTFTVAATTYVDEYTDKMQFYWDVTKFLESLQKTYLMEHIYIFKPTGELWIIFGKDDIVEFNLFEHKNSFPNLEKAFRNVIQNKTTIISDFEKDFDDKKEDTVFYVLAPIFKQDEFIGIIAFHQELEMLQKLLYDESAEFETENSFIISNEIVISKDSIGKLKDKEKYIFNKCKDKPSLYEYDNQLGIVTCLKEKKYGIVTELSKKEIYRPIMKTNKILFNYFLILLIIIIIFTIIVAKHFTNPIVKLQKITNKVTSGNLHIKLKKTRNDEIGELYALVNTMIKRLRESKLILEKKSS
jgi:HAMP domain-containing protein